MSPGDALTVASFSGISLIVTIILGNQVAWRNTGVCAGALHAVVFPYELQTLYRAVSKSNQKYSNELWLKGSKGVGSAHCRYVDSRRRNASST